MFTFEINRWGRLCVAKLFWTDANISKYCTRMHFGVKIMLMLRWIWWNSWVMWCSAGAGGHRGQVEQGLEHGLEEDLHPAGHPGEAERQAAKEEKGAGGGGEERHSWSRGGAGAGAGGLLVSFKPQPPISSPTLARWAEREMEKNWRKWPRNGETGGEKKIWCRECKKHFISWERFTNLTKFNKCLSCQRNWQERCGEGSDVPEFHRLEFQILKRTIHCQPFTISQ